MVVWKNGILTRKGKEVALVELIPPNVIVITILSPVSLSVPDLMPVKNSSNIASMGSLLPAYQATGKSQRASLLLGTQRTVSLLNIILRAVRDVIGDWYDITVSKIAAANPNGNGNNLGSREDNNQMAPINKRRSVIF